MTQYDLAILGGGSAAFAAAIKATDLGAEVVICEERVIGGTCLNRGCIPSKNLLKASEVFYYSHHQPFKGIEIPKGSVDFDRVIEQKGTQSSLCAYREYGEASTTRVSPTNTNMEIEKFS